jgi:hypothetical protein
MMDMGEMPNLEAWNWYAIIRYWPLRYNLGMHVYLRSVRSGGGSGGCGGT